MAETARSASEKKPLAERSLLLVDEAAAADQFAIAQQLVEIALDAARGASEIELIKQVVVRKKEIEGLAETYAKVQKARAALENNCGR